MSQPTKDWELYLAGKKYNNSLKPNYYDTVNANLAFFEGDQWRNSTVHDLPKPVFNIIKRVITFFVASLTSTKTSVQFEPLAYSGDNEQDPQLEAAEIATAELENLFEKFKFEHRTRDALFDAAVTGDKAAHFYFETSKKPYGGAFPDIMGEICMELVDGSNVMFGNANTTDVEGQPYIIVIGRDMVENLRKEAARHQAAQTDLDSIQEDSENQYQAGDNAKFEVQADNYGRSLYIIVYRKQSAQVPKLDETGNPVLDEMGQPVTEEKTHVFASKSVESAYIYQDIDTGLDFYPISWLCWEKQKNQYHGRAVCTGMLPNQIFINRMFAMVMYHLMMSAFPKAVYDSDKIPYFSNQIGDAIAVNNLSPGDNIRNIAAYLEPGNMSNQIVQVIELAIQYTKEMLGINDASLGNIDPKNTSAIIAVQKSTVIPLENVRGNLYEWVEDCGRILLDMMGTYYGPRPIVVSDGNGGKTVKQFDFAVFKNLWLRVKADVGSSSYWSEIASLQTLDNLLQANRIDFVEYLERVPDEYIPQKGELITALKAKANTAPAPQPDLPSISIKFETLPEVARAQILQQIGIQVNPQDFAPQIPLQQGGVMNGETSNHGYANDYSGGQNSA